MAEAKQEVKDEKHFDKVVSNYLVEVLGVSKGSVVCLGEGVVARCNQHQGVEDGLPLAVDRNYEVSEERLLQVLNLFLRLLLIFKIQNLVFIALFKQGLGVRSRWDSPATGGHTEVLDGGEDVDAIHD